MTETQGVIMQCHAALTTAGVSLYRSDGAPRPLMERIAILADERNRAREEGRREGFEKAREMAQADMEKRAVTADEFEHHSTANVWRNAASIIRAIRDEAGEANPRKCKNTTKDCRGMHTRDCERCDACCGHARGICATRTA